LAILPVPVKRVDYFNAWRIDKRFEGTGGTPVLRCPAHFLRRAPCHPDRVIGIDEIAQIIDIIAAHSTHKKMKKSSMFAGLFALYLSGAALCQSQPTYTGADKTLIPNKGWDCGMPEGIPVPERGAPVFEAVMTLDQSYHLGQTPYGNRDALVIATGTVTGEKIKGSVMPGALDFQLSFPGGMEIEEILVLKTSDSKYIYVRSPGTAAHQNDVRMVLDFEAPNSSPYAWLNTGKYVGRRVVDSEAKTLKITVFDISNAPAASGSLSLVKPENLPNQPWNYRKVAPGEKRGAQLIVENVTLGKSQSVGASKRGGRNIIPITGGTLSGKITGKVLSGGADYQSLGNPATLDARYLWQTSEGDVIIVRNAGPISSLAPIFEVNVDSKYSFLNKGVYQSSGPGMGAGGVGLTFYETEQ
jgi:hypothetical protein